MDWKKIGKKLLFPPIFVMLILTAFSTAALVFVFVEGLSESLIAYITYVISFYTLTVLSVFFSAFCFFSDFSSVFLSEEEELTISTSTMACSPMIAPRIPRKNLSLPDDRFSICFTLRKLRVKRGCRCRKRICCAGCRRAGQPEPIPKMRSASCKTAGSRLF